MLESRVLSVELYRPHAAQRRLHDSKARFRVCCCGRRWGKTLAALNEGSKHGLEHAGNTIMWVAPTYRQTMIAFRLATKALKGVMASDPSKAELRFELLNETTWQFASAERYDNLRGEGVDFLIMDETAQIDERAWTESLSPTLSDTGGRVIFIGTPRGRNWFWNLFQTGLDPLEEEYESFTFPTASNPYIPAKEIASAKRRSTEDVFRQEYMAEFLEESAGVFRNVDACVSGGFVEYNPHCSYLLGWDPAKYEDFSVLTVLNLDTLHVDAWQRFNKIDYIFQLERVHALADEYHADVIMDATGVGDPLVEQVRAMGLYVECVKFTNVLKEQHIRRLAVALERCEITYPRIPVLISELKAFEQHRSEESGNMHYGAPAGIHDDAVISLALVVKKLEDYGDVPLVGSLRAPDLADIPALSDFSDLNISEEQKQFLRKREEQAAKSLAFIRNPLAQLLGKRSD